MHLFDPTNTALPLTTPQVSGPPPTQFLRSAPGLTSPLSCPRKPIVLTRPGNLWTHLLPDPLKSCPTYDCEPKPAPLTLPRSPSHKSPVQLTGSTVAQPDPLLPPQPQLGLAVSGLVGQNLVQHTRSGSAYQSPWQHLNTPENQFSSFVFSCSFSTTTISSVYSFLNSFATTPINL